MEYKTLKRNYTQACERLRACVDSGGSRPPADVMATFESMVEMVTRYIVAKFPPPSGEGVGLVCFSSARDLYKFIVRAILRKQHSPFNMTLVPHAKIRLLASRDILPNLGEGTDDKYLVVSLAITDFNPYSICMCAQKMSSTAGSGVFRAGSTKQSRGCNFCGRNDSSHKMKLRLCSRCREAQYCCVEHQRADWQTHKLVCKK
jgi:hypothetical protein